MKEMHFRTVFFYLFQETLCHFCQLVSALWRKVSQKTSTSNGGKVQIYILMGQSNMLGMGHVHGRDKDGTLEYAVFQKGLYSYLIDEERENWLTSDTVRNVRVMDARDGKMHTYENEFMNPNLCETIGPEIGIGYTLSTNNKNPIMLLKSCIGNRSLGWDLLPPGSVRYDYKDKTYAGYKDSPALWPKGQPKPDPVDWYAGKQYDTDIANAKSVLSELDKYFPGSTNYEIAGFFWWQGDKDRYDAAYASMYERNLVRLIQQLRNEFQAPKSKFVLATLGQTSIDDAKDNDKLLIDAMLAVDGSAKKYPDFVGNVSCIYSHPLSKGGSSNGHYNGNAETYMNIGEAMGKAMLELKSNDFTRSDEGGDTLV